MEKKMEATTLFRDYVNHAQVQGLGFSHMV